MVMFVDGDKPTLAVNEKPEVVVGVVLLKLLHGDLLGVGIGLGHCEEYVFVLEKS